MSVKLVVLKTGEQILGNTEKHKDDFNLNGVLIKKPAILVPAEKGIGLAPWIPYTKAAEGVFIKHESISFIVDPIDELKNHYTGSFVGGLVIPTNEVATPQLQLTEG